MAIAHLMQCAVAPGQCMVSRRLIGTSVFHSHLAALMSARQRNQRAGFKVVKIVVVAQHFVIADFTWERNT